MAIVKKLISKAKEKPQAPRIIRPGERNLSGIHDHEEIPFVPAYDLLEAKEREIRDEEIAATAVAMFEAFRLHSSVQDGKQTWRTQAALDAVSRREFE